MGCIGRWLTVNWDDKSLIYDENILALLVGALWYLVVCGLFFIPLSEAALTTNIAACLIFFPVYTGK